MQKTPITLTAAELYVLGDLDHSTGREAFKLTLTELLSRGVIRFHREKGKVLWVIPKEDNYLALVPNRQSQAGAKKHVSAVLDLVARTQEQPFGAKMENVVKAARRGPFGKDLGSYKSDFVIPSLASEGMVTAQEGKAVGIFKWTRYVPSPKGTSTLQKLKELQLEAQDLPELARQNPHEAIALMSLIGSGLILMPELRPHYQEIGAGLRDSRRRAEGGDSADSGGDGFGGEGEGGVPFSDLAAQFEVGFAGLLDSMDGITDSFDGVLDAFDGSFDAADTGGGDGGDGGGDGGGGGD